MGTGVVSHKVTKALCWSHPRTLLSKRGGRRELMSHLINSNTSSPPPFLNKITRWSSPRVNRITTQSVV